MTLLSEYAEWSNGRKIEIFERLDLAKLAAFMIFKDITGRSGIDGALDSIESDIKEEMLQSWVYSIAKIAPVIDEVHVNALAECSNLLEQISDDEVDDPEELFTEFSCEGNRYSDAIGEVLQKLILD